MFRKILGLALLGTFIGCAQADPVQYKEITRTPVYGESNGVFYDATNDYLSLFVNDTEVGYIDSSGNLTMDGSVAAQSLDPADDSATCFGTSDDACFEFNAADMVPDSMVIGVGTESRQLIIGETADVSGAAAVDLAIAQQTNPTLNIHSADGTDALDYITFAHNQTNGVIDVGQGYIALADSTWLTDDLYAYYGASNDGFVAFDVTTQAPDSMVVGVGTESRQLVVMESADVATDLTIAQQTNPTLLIHSADATDALDYITFAHDQTNGVIDVGQGAVSIPDGITTAKTGGAALTCTGAAPTIELKDNEAAALGIGRNDAAGSLMVFDLTNANEEVNIVGTTATSAFRVDTGFATFDEKAVFTAGLSSAVTAADIMTLTGAAPNITIKDNEADALTIASSGAANMMFFDTTTDNEEVNINGTIAASSFRVDSGFATFDEQAVFSAGADVNGDLLLGGGAGTLTVDAASGSILMSGAADNVAAGLDIGSTGATSTMRFVTTDTAEGVTLTLGATGSFLILASGSAGWLDGASGNQACNTTCAGTGACLFGFDTAAPALVDCADAAADSCICGGPAS